jgi:hypothetical protein
MSDMCSTCAAKSARRCSDVGNRKGGPEELQALAVLHVCARFATPQPRPHWTFKGSSRFTKAADTCGTVGNAGEELH